MKKKIFIVSIFFSLATLATIGTKIINNNGFSTSDLLFTNMEALASEENPGSGDYSRGYINNPTPCTVTETVQCSISVPIKWLEWCKFNFSYTVEHAGTQNYCTYTGGSSRCDYHTCKRNG